jgi:pimeloyl-ACP methyl ester carboxylesterase
MSDSGPPVVLVHGWGGSFVETWQRSGMTALIAEAGREVIGVDLLGHGTAPKPHEPEAYEDLTTRIVEALPDGPVDAIGFSLGAITLLQLACQQPHRFHRLVVAGIGENVFRQDDDHRRRIIDGIEGRADPGDIAAQVFANYADRPGQDAVALAAVMKRPRSYALTPERLAAVSFPVLVAIGDKDFAGPGQPLAEALPHGTLATLRNVDHFATPEAFAFIDAALEFLDCV